MPKAVLYPFLALWVIVIVSALFSEEIRRGISIFFDHYLYRSLPAFIILLTVRDKKRILRLAICLGLSIIVNGLVGISQSVIAIGDYASRHSGIIHYMMQATILAMTIPIFFIAALRENEPRYKLAATIAFLIAVVAMIFNSRRGAWVAVAISLPIVSYFAVQAKRKWFMGMGAVIIIVALIFAVSPSFSGRLQTIADPATHSRTERLLIWQSAINMYEDHPLLGVGPGQFAREYRGKYISPEALEPELGHAHNIYLGVFSECGTLGGAAFIVFWICLFTSTIRAYHRTHDIAYMAILSAALGLALHGVTEYTWGATLTMKFFWTILGLSYAWARLTDGRYKLK
ncbi:MAG: O-antigen ligase family protein [Selenomonadaceae bacterium]